MTPNSLKLSHLTKTSTALVFLMIMLERGCVSIDMNAKAVEMLDDLFTPNAISTIGTC